ncbi:MAG TPA: histidine--tRNA ligase [bacterium]|nr:histidine--tRNA ligase [bacterium]
MKPLPPKGTRDYFPGQLRAREHVISTVKRVFESYGYAPLETPAVERLDVLTGKYGDEADRLIFRILKRGAAGERGEADLGLRYDLTVPLARVMAANQDLPKPFKRYQIQPVWRAERPQKGRFREFVQCDVDCVGAASVLADAEMIALMHETLAALGFKNYRISVNHRKILSAFMDAAGIAADAHPAAIRAIDKFDKIGEEGVEEELVKAGTTADEARHIVAALLEPTTANFDAYAEAARQAVGGLPEGLAGVADMEKLAEYLNYFGVPDDVLRFDLHMARGLDYYTGPIFEALVPEAGVGSLAGGGRYDRLIAQLGGPDLPATGTSFGLERIIAVVEERGAAATDGACADVLVAVYDETVLAEALKAAAELRAAGLKCETYLEAGAKLGKQLGYADAKGFPVVVIIGPDEVARGIVQLKDFAKREQVEVPRAEVAAAVAKTLERT